MLWGMMMMMMLMMMMVMMVMMVMMMVMMMTMVVVVVVMVVEALPMMKTHGSAPQASPFLLRWTATSARDTAGPAYAPAPVKA
jgi:hypothetical protein